MNKWQELIEIYQDVADAVGGDVRTDYSGRGMYGKTCLALVSDCSGVDIGIEFYRRCTEFPEDEQGWAVDFAPVLTDNMGREYIFYCPKANEESLSALDD